MGLFKRITGLGSSSGRASTSDNVETNDETPQKKSIITLVPLNEVTEASLKVFRQLPAAIRHDPSMISFQQENERWKAEHGDEYDESGARRSAEPEEEEEQQQQRRQSSFSNKKTDDIETIQDLEDSDSDNCEFITIKVTNSEGKTEAQEIDHIKEHHKPREEIKDRVHFQVAPHQDTPPKEEEHHDEQSNQNPFHKYGKTGLLVFVWIFMVLFLTRTPEKIIEKRQLSIPIDAPRIYNFPSLPTSTKINVTLEGAFLPEAIEQHQRRQDILNRRMQSVQMKADEKEKENLLRIYLQTEKRSLTPPKIFEITSPEVFDFANTTRLNLMFDIGEDMLEVIEENDERIQLVIETNFTKLPIEKKQEMPLIFSYDINPLNKQIGPIFAAFVLIFLYALIIWEIVHRTFAAMIASTLSIAFLAALNDRPTHHEIISWIDVETILLLFSMMILVAILTETGVFDHLAVYAYKITNGKIWPLIHALCIITCFISMLLDNVTTVLLMAPITITLCEDLDLNPVPVLMAIVVHANIGGTTTPVGDPPNIITSNPTILDSGVTFISFTFHMLIGVIILTITTNLHLRFNYKDINTLFIHEPKEIKVLKRNIVIWERTAASISPFSKDANMVRETLIKKVKILKHDLKKKIAKGGIATARYKSTLEEMEKAYPIKKKGLLIKSGVALTFILVLFLVESFPQIHRLSLGWSALIGVILLLIISNRDDMDAILHRVEFSTLLFFAAMFVLMEAIDRMGFIAMIGSGCEDIIKSVSKDYRLAVAIIIILWVSAITSAFVDSIPVTQMMVKIVISLAGRIGLPLQPLVWALAFGPSLGGNGTVVGASANVICAGIAEQHGYKMTFMDFFKFGFPIMIGSIVITTAYLLFAHCLFTWH